MPSSNAVAFEDWQAMKEILRKNPEPPEAGLVGLGGRVNR